MSVATRTEDLASRWRERAEDVRRFAPAAAEAFLEAAQDFEDWRRERLQEPLGIHTAAAESGYSPRHLRRLLREGTVPNSGTADEPRILRGHLPKKPGHRPVALADTDEVGPDLRTQVARAVAAGD